MNTNFRTDVETNRAGETPKDKKESQGLLFVIDFVIMFHALPLLFKVRMSQGDSVLHSQLHFISFLLEADTSFTYVDYCMANTMGLHRPIELKVALIIQCFK